MPMFTVHRMPSSHYRLTASQRCNATKNVVPTATKNVTGSSFAHSCDTFVVGRFLQVSLGNRRTGSALEIRFVREQQLQVHSGNSTGKYSSLIVTFPDFLIYL